MKRKFFSWIALSLLTLTTPSQAQTTNERGGARRGQQLTPMVRITLKCGNQSRVLCAIMKPSGIRVKMPTRKTDVWLLKGGKSRRKTHATKQEAEEIGAAKGRTSIIRQPPSPLVARFLSSTDDLKLEQKSLRQEVLGQPSGFWGKGCPGHRVERLT